MDIYGDDKGWRRTVLRTGNNEGRARSPNLFNKKWHLREILNVLIRNLAILL